MASEKLSGFLLWVLQQKSSKAADHKDLSLRKMQPEAKQELPVIQVSSETGLTGRVLVSKGAFCLSRYWNFKRFTGVLSSKCLTLFSAVVKEERVTDDGPLWWPAYSRSAGSSALYRYQWKKHFNQAVTAEAEENVHFLIGVILWGHAVN